MNSAKYHEVFETALKQTWQMIDPLRPAGQPGSYARGEYNGICAALKTIRENFDRALDASSPEALEASALDTLVAVADYLGLEPAEEEARPGYDPKGPASKTIIAAIERKFVSPPPQEPAPEAALRDIAAERKRQVEVEGWTPEHDDEYQVGVLAAAAACYAIGRSTLRAYQGAPDIILWPWHSDWWKPGDRRRNLIKAGALIVAEIERLDRATMGASKGKSHD